MFETNVRSILLIVVLIVAAAVAGFVGGYVIAPREVIEGAAEEEEPIRIGSAHPLTGWAAADGLEMHRGMEMAVEEINALGGILGRSIEWIEVDAGSMSAEETKAAFESLALVHKVDFVVYGYMAIYGPQYDTLGEYGLPFIHADTVYDFVEWCDDHPEYKWLAFQADPPETYYGHGLATYAKELIDEGKWNPINNKIALIRGEDTYGQLIAQIFKEDMEAMGWETIIDETVAFGTVEFGPILAKIRATPPAYIMFTDYSPSDIANFMLQFREDPTNSLVYGQYAPGVPEFIELAGESANGLLWSTLFGNLYDEYAQPFWDKYEEKYGEVAGSFAGPCYDMMWFMANAIALAGTTEKEAVAEAMQRQIYRGVSGTIRIRPDTKSAYHYPSDVSDPSLGLPHQILQIQNLEHKIISPTPYETGEFQLPPWFT